MGFTTPCFIRKQDTTELRNKLNKLGYFPHPTANPLYNNRNGELHTGRGFYANLPIGYIEEIKNAIDCGTNEELFLAIAALRDDKDEHQLFISDSLLHIAFDDEIGNDHYFTYPSGIIFKWDYHWDNCTIKGEFHKMSVEELINHFKFKINQK